MAIRIRLQLLIDYSRANEKQLRQIGNAILQWQESGVYSLGPLATHQLVDLLNGDKLVKNEPICLECSDEEGNYKLKRLIPVKAQEVVSVRTVEG